MPFLQNPWVDLNPGRERAPAGSEPEARLSTPRARAAAGPAGAPDLGRALTPAPPCAPVAQTACSGSRARPGPGPPRCRRCSSFIWVWSGTVLPLSDATFSVSNPLARREPRLTASSPASGRVEEGTRSAELRTWPGCVGKGRAAGSRAPLS